MKVAVTGATGFIGQHVVAALDCHSFSPSMILRPSSILPESFSKYTVVRLDVARPPVNAFHLMGKPDVLIHLAWDGLPNYKSLNHFEMELPAQYRFLKELIHAGLKHLVVIGTCFEYGMQSGPLNENAETNPTNAYGFAKDALRRQLEFLQFELPFSLTWIRLFYLYGDGQAKMALFPQLQRAVERGDKVFNMSGGEQLRDYLHVTEAVEYIVSLAQKEQGNGIVNVCSGEPISIRRLVEGWILDANWSIDLNLGYYPYPDHEPMAFWGDNRKLRQCIGKS